MQLNQGKFSGNGRCGYVLKPQYLMDETFRPDQPLSLASAQTTLTPGGTTIPFLSTTGADGSASAPILSNSSNNHSGAAVIGNFPITLTLQVISGRHLSRKDHNKGICSPFVEIEIAGF